MNENIFFEKHVYRVPDGFFEILDLSYFTAGIRDFKAIRVGGGGGGVRD